MVVATKGGPAMQELDEQRAAPHEIDGPRQWLRWVREVCGASYHVLPRAFIAACAILMLVGLVPPPASADIGACPSTEPPRNQSEAIDRAALAFDGVVVDGRELPGSTEGTLVSPLVFRVSRDVKGAAASYGRRSSSGDVFVTVWDAGYWRPALRRKVLESGQDVTVPGEIEATRGQAWRVYVLNEEGVNFTATTCLGSHVLARRPASPPGSATSGGSSWIPVGLVVALAMVLLVLGGWFVSRRGRREGVPDDALRDRGC